MARSAQRPRNLLVWMHVLTSVGWMSQALAMGALLALATSTGDPAVRLGAVTMAEFLDEQLLLHMANASAFTGLMLSALTPWGYFRHWWVLVKFVITISQLYVGIFVLSPNLAAAVRAAEGGEPLPPTMAVAAFLMASAIAFQAWASVAKPWNRTPWSRSARSPRKVPSAPGRMFVLATAVPVFEFVLSTVVLGFPLPALSLFIAVGYPIRRSRRLRRSAPDTGSTAAAAPHVEASS